jgi:glycosyltransferase involved in cell wall biosynthesis
MLYFVIPVYNEEMNISELADSLLKVLPDEKNSSFSLMTVRQTELSR